MIDIAAEESWQLEPERIPMRLHSQEAENSLYQFCSPQRGCLNGAGDWSSHASADKPETPCLQMHFEQCQLCITSFSKEVILMLKGKTVRRQLLVLC